MQFKARGRRIRRIRRRIALSNERESDVFKPDLDNVVFVYDAEGHRINECDAPTVIDADGNVVSTSADWPADSEDACGRFVWTGREIDVETELQYLRPGGPPDPRVGRFLEKDGEDDDR